MLSNQMTSQFLRVSLLNAPVCDVRPAGLSRQAVTLETLAEQLVELRAALAEVAQAVQQLPRPVVQEQGEYQPRFDRIDQALEQMKALIQETQQKNVPSSQNEQDASTSVGGQPMQEVMVSTPKTHLVSEAPASSLLPAKPKSTLHPPSERAKATSTTKHAAKKKRTSKAKSLPRTLVPLRVFAKQHEIDMKVADRVSESGNLAVVSGNWLYESRVVAKALNAEGQQDFYRVFHTREGFTRCEHCPHGFQEQDSRTEAETVDIAG